MSKRGEARVARILGIGGVFFKSSDPTAVARWYGRVLDFPHEAGWNGARFTGRGPGYQVWSPFNANTRYFEPSPLPYMVNLTVDDLDGVLDRAQRQGVLPVGREDDPLGRFAWLVDPWGQKLELWEPDGGPDR